MLDLSKDPSFSSGKKQGILRTLSNIYDGVCWQNKQQLEEGNYFPVRALSIMLEKTIKYDSLSYPARGQSYCWKQ